MKQPTDALKVRLRILNSTSLHFPTIKYCQEINRVFLALKMCSIFSMCTSVSLECSAGAIGWPFIFMIDLSGWVLGNAKLPWVEQNASKLWIEPSCKK